MKARTKIAVLAAACVFLSHRAAAEPAPTPVRLLSAAQCRTEGGTDLQLEPGRYLPEPVWSSLDFEVRRLQTAETRLTAENNEFRRSARDGAGVWSHIVTAGAALAAGIGIGLYASR